MPYFLDYRFYIMLGEVSTEWDATLSKLLDDIDKGFVKAYIDDYRIYAEGHAIWVKSWPYSYGTNRDSQNWRPRRKTAIRLRKLEERLRG